MSTHYSTIAARSFNLLSPDSRWIIVGGSPCQDLTFAGAHRGIIGLVGKSSRLFFTLLGVIRAVQEISEVGRVRYLIENAGSMNELHFQAFCDLLGLCHRPKAQYLWELADLDFPITGERKFFTNDSDKRNNPSQPPIKFDGGGPLHTQEGKPLTFGPLLRTSELVPFDVCWASWTLYQPSAPV